MKRKYSDDYSPLALLVGGGNVVAYNADYDKVERSLMSLPVGSIEYFLKSLNKEVLFLPMTSDFNKLVLSRFKGSAHISQEFYLASFYQRYDGVFFINNSIDKANPETNNHSFKEAQDKFILKKSKDKRFWKK